MEYYGGERPIWEVNQGREVTRYNQDIDIGEVPPPSPGRMHQICLSVTSTTGCVSCNGISWEKSSPTNECDFPGHLGGLHPREALPSLRLRWGFV